MIHNALCWRMGWGLSSRAFLRPPCESRPARYDSYDLGPEKHIHRHSGKQRYVHRTRVIPCAEEVRFESARRAGE